MMSTATGMFQSEFVARFAMLVAVAVVAGLPLWAAFTRVLSFKRDILFVLFWGQSWVYLHLIPTLNALFPDSDFAFPPHQAHLRVIQFTGDQLAMYAVLQWLVVLCFFLPMMILYVYLIRKTRHESLVATGERRRGVILKNVFILGVFYSLFGIMFYEVAFRTGLLSPYAQSLDLFSQLSHYDHWVWKMYLLSGPFVFTVLALAWRELDARQRPLRWYAFASAAPGIILQVAWLFTSSRASVGFVLLATGGIFVVRGQFDWGRIPKGLLLRAGVAFSVFLYGLQVIPQLRQVVLIPHATFEDYTLCLNPLASRKYEESLALDFGFRLDGLELMVLATPQLSEMGPAFGERYVLAILSPVLPLIPALNRRLKFEEGSLDFKQYYLAKYTTIQSPDYPAGALADAYVAFGPVGILIASVAYAGGFAFLRRLIGPSTHDRRLLLGIFLLYNIFLYEFPFASLPLGWVRSLPVLVICMYATPFVRVRQRDLDRIRSKPVRSKLSHIRPRIT